RIGDAGAAALARLDRLTALALDGLKAPIWRDAGFPALVRLTLNHARIDEVEPSFWRRAALRSVVARRAALGRVPPSLLSRSYEDNCLPRIRDWLDACEAGPPEALRDVKVMILGNGQIGKTQLKRHLCGEPFQVAPSTHGVEIALAPLPADAPEAAPAPAPPRRGAKARLGARLFGRPAPASPSPEPPAAGAETPLRIWDFGGQDIYLGTHALFLRSQAVFPIVWTPSAETNESHEVDGVVFQNRPLDYWVRYVRQFGGARSPALLVQSQVDQPHQGRDAPADPALRAEFAFPMGRDEEIRFSALSGHGAGDLRQGLRRAVDHLFAERAVSQIGPRWAEVKRDLDAWRAAIDARRAAGAALSPEERAHQVLTQDAFAAFCAARGIESASQAKTLLRLLHDLGVVFHQPDLLDDAVILDQQWALDAIYALFNRERGVYARLTDAPYFGCFTRSDLGAWLWNGLGFSVEEQELFLGMMRACALCFTLRKGEPGGLEALYCAPELLPELGVLTAHRALHWDAAAGAAHQTSYAFSLTPEPLLRGLMAEIGEAGGQNGDYWRGGLRFTDADTGARAWIETQPAEAADAPPWAGRLVIMTQSGRADALMARLREMVDRSLDRLGVAADAVDPPPERGAAEGPAEARAAPPRPTAEPRAAGAPREVYISYAHGDDDSAGGRARKQALKRTVAHLKEGLGLTPIWDEIALANGASITQFRERYADAAGVVAILSRKYLLESDHCMPELIAHWRGAGSDDAFRDSTRAVVLADADLSRDARAAVEARWREIYEQRMGWSGATPLEADQTQIAGLLSTQARHVLGLLEDSLHIVGAENIDALRFRAGAGAGA
ncbi:MAG: COR domain-containing protein, partial [Pseudomonadota bacterium]